MAHEETLWQLLAANDRHADSLPEGYFAAVTDTQEPAVVSVCCSDSRVSQEGMWSVDRPGWLFAPSTIGNLVWDRHEGRRVVDGSVLYPVRYTGTDVAVVVGHTGCGAVTAALEAVRQGGIDAPPGVRRRIELLAPVVESAIADGTVDPSRADGLVDRLVEHNVDRQVAFLLDSEDVPDDVSAYGFVYDFREVYGDVPGRAYLTNVDGETDVETVRGLVPGEFEDHVRRLV